MPYRIGYLDAEGDFIEDSLRKGDVLVVGRRRGWGKLRRPQKTGSKAIIDTALFFQNEASDKMSRELPLNTAGQGIPEIVSEFLTRHGIDLTRGGTLRLQEDKRPLKMHSLLLGQRLFVIKAVKKSS